MKCRTMEYVTFLKMENTFPQAKRTMLKEHTSVASVHAEVLGGSLPLWIAL